MTDEPWRVAPVGACRGWLAHNTRNCPCYAAAGGEMNPEEQPMTTIATRTGTVEVPLSDAVANLTLDLVVTKGKRTRARLWLGGQMIRLAAAIMGCNVEVSVRD